MIKSFFITLLSIVVMSACSSAPKDTSLVNLTVGSKQADCVGVGPQKCYIIKKGTEPHWSYLYSGIEGFSNYQEGYEYEVQVKEVKRTPTAADVSTTGYVFVKEISKVQKDSKGMPGFSRER